MQRIPEPELMDADAQALAYAAADFSETDRAFVAGFATRFGSVAGDVLELGCGPGNITLLLARVLPDARVVAVDGSEAMLRIARARRAEHRGGARVELRRAVLPSDALPGGVAAVVSNSLLHHLHDPDVMWRTVASCAAKGAPIWIGDLRRPESPERAREIVASAAGDAPAVLQDDYFASLCAAFEPDEVRAQLDRCGLGRLEVQRVGERYLVVAGRAP